MAELTAGELSDDVDYRVPYPPPHTTMLSNELIRAWGGCNRSHGGLATHGVVDLADGEVTHDGEATQTLPMLTRTP